jgi:hypothetical protein
MPRWSMVPRPNLVCWKYLAETHNAETAGAVAGIGSQGAQALHNCTAVAATQRWRERIPSAKSRRTSSSPQPPHWLLSSMGNSDRPESAAMPALG